MLQTIVCICVILRYENVFYIEINYLIPPMKLQLNAWSLFNDI